MKINTIQKISFGLGGGVNAIKTDFFVWYLGAYYLTVLGLSPLLTGFALLIALFIDALSDPLIGTFSDRIRSKFGRRHVLMTFSLFQQNDYLEIKLKSRQNIELSSETQFH